MKKRDPKKCRYMMFYSDGEYLPSSDMDTVCDEVDTRLYLMDGVVLIVNENLSRDEVERVLPDMLDILDSQQKETKEEAG